MQIKQEEKKLFLEFFKSLDNRINQMEIKVQNDIFNELENLKFEYYNQYSKCKFFY